MKPYIKYSIKQLENDRFCIEREDTNKIPSENSLLLDYEASASYFTSINRTFFDKKSAETYVHEILSGARDSYGRFVPRTLEEYKL